LTIGGFSKLFANVVGDAIFTVSNDIVPLGTTKKLIIIGLPVDQAFDAKAPGLFTKEHPLGKAFCNDMAKSMVAHDAKAEEMNAALALPKNKDWVGSLARVSVDLAQFRDALAADLPGVAIDPADKARSPWMAAHSDGFWRWGPAASAMPGLANFVSASPCGSDTNWVMFFPLKPILSEGIPIRDSKAFLDTSTGAAYVQAEVMFCQLREDELAYCPYGWMMSPIFMVKPKDAELKVGGRKKATKVAAATGTQIHFTVFDAAAAAAIDRETWAAIETLNTQHLEANKANPLWAPRHAFFPNFSDEVTKLRSAA
jgi:hypothetical protein